jgi:hypothetical protein
LAAVIVALSGPGLLQVVAEMAARLAAARLMRAVVQLWKPSTRFCCLGLRNHYSGRRDRAQRPGAGQHASATPFFLKRRSSAGGACSTATSGFFCNAWWQSAFPGPYSPPC